jgi:MoaA/NifB/PqqE/SkfB family radical SAM enzyme
MSLDGSTAEIHDTFRGVPGSYDRTLEAVRWAGELGLPVQINTAITRLNLAAFEGIVRLLEKLDIVLWSVFLLVPTGRGRASDLISAQEIEEVFQKLYDLSLRVPFDIKTTEAPHYRRFVAQRRADARRQTSASPPWGRATALHGASTTRRGSSLFPIRETFSPAGSYPSRHETYASKPWQKFTGKRRCSSLCVTRPT